MAIGTPLVVKAIQEKRVYKVFIACDPSANTEKKITDKCAYYGVDCVKTSYTAEQLAGAIGKTGAVCALGITDKNFSNELSTLNLNETR